MSTPKSQSLRISLLLLVEVLLGVVRAGCEAPTTTLRTELEDLQEMKSRLLVDFPAGPYGPRRLMYVENRETSVSGASDCAGLNSFLQPQQWAVGFSGPQITAGPVSLRGILAQLYNPLTHSPGSDAFSEPSDLSLNIDLDMGGRRGLQLSMIPGYWSLLGIYTERTGAQLGSAVTIPVGRSLDFSLIGLLSSPPEMLGHEQSWYAEESLFPGGLMAHLAGSLIWEHSPLRVTLVAAAAAGQLVGPGTVLTLDMSLSAAPVDLALLFGFCSPRYFTPEGDTGDLEWIAAAQADKDFGPIHLSAGCSKELCPLSPFPEVFRGGCDRFDAGIEIVRRRAAPWVWSIEGEAVLQREWSAEGRENSFRCLEAGLTLDWSAWTFTGEVSEVQDGESEPVRDARIAVGHDPAWGKIELEAGYRRDPGPGIDLAAAFDATGEDKRLYIRIATEDVVSAPAFWDSLHAGDWLDFFTLRLGWEASTD